MGHRILGVFGFEDEEPGEADCMVCYERLRSDAWMIESFCVGTGTIMKFDKYSRVVQNTSYFVQVMIQVAAFCLTLGVEERALIKCFETVSMEGQILGHVEME